MLVGRCLPYGEGITYWPLQELASQVGDVRAALQGASDAELAAVRIEAALGATDTPVSPEEISWGVRRLLEAMATTGPLVVVFDDIHWAETAFLDLVEYLASFVQEVPLLLLCTARPDLFETRPTWTAPRPNAIVLTLDPLSEEDSETLVERLGDLPEETRERIVDAAEGNPLFVEQLVAMRAEGGDGELEVPPTLQALLAARIDQLARAGARRGRARLGRRAALPPRRRRCAAVRARATRGRHAPADARPQGADPTRPGDAAGRRRLPLRSHPHPRRRVRRDSQEAARRAPRAVRDWLVSKLGEDAPDEIVGYHLEQAYRYGVELGAPDPALGARASERLAAAASAARIRGDIPAAGEPLAPCGRPGPRRGRAPVVARPLRLGARGGRGAGACPGGGRGGGGACARGRRRARRVAGADRARRHPQPPGARGRL